MSTLASISFSNRTRLGDLAEILDRDWDIEFDATYDDLEREFAELRLLMNHCE